MIKFKITGAKLKKIHVTEKMSFFYLPDMKLFSYQFKNFVYLCKFLFIREVCDLETYFDVGKLIVEAQGGEIRAKYGDKLIKEDSKKLTNELGRG
ncbi:MAG: hypothetical protein IKO98_05180, partial [Bacteroidales bacterium]|nr:hypothetical protein [Bacteroidales bacterium]